VLPEWAAINTMRARSVLHRFLSVQVYAGPLQGGGRAVVLLNRLHAGGPNVVTVSWGMLGLNETQEVRVLKIATCACCRCC
jgi:hypothetical protein